MKTCARCQTRYPDALEKCPRDGTILPPSPGQTQALYDSMIGTTLDGRYKIEAKLGEGGMGLVYSAHHVLIEKRVAIKMLKTEAQDDATAGQRFIQEAKAASKINHANIVDITDFGQTPEGNAYFVMEFLEGHTLGDVLDEGPIAANRVIHIAIQVARGLHAAHTKGIIHRDLKPENIFLLDRDGVGDIVKIVDFGIAKVQEGGALGKAGRKLTQAGMVLGTPEYMSPEQATGKETDHRVDEYALGCIMYEMLTGEVPYHGDTSAGTLTKHVFEPIVSPRKRCPDLGIPPALDAVVVKTMAKDRDERYPNLRELIVALEQAASELGTGQVGVPTLEEAPPTVTTSALAEETDEPPRSRTGLIIGGIVAGVLAAAAAIILLRPSSTPHAQPAVVDLRPPVPIPVLDPLALPARVEVTIQSTPANAEIYQDGQLVGLSPQALSLPRGGVPVELVIKKAGFQEHQEIITPDRDRLLSLTLAPAKKEPGKGRTKTHGGTKLPRVPDPKRPPGASDLRNPFGD